MINGPRRSRIGPKLTEIRASKVGKTRKTYGVSWTQADADAATPFARGGGDCGGAGQQGLCVQGTFIYSDNHLGLLLAPYAYQRVHDRRFHVVFGEGRADASPGCPVTDASLVVDRHDFKHEMPVIADFVDAMHAAAATGDYSAINARNGAEKKKRRAESHIFSEPPELAHVEVCSGLLP